MNDKTTVTQSLATASTKAYRAITTIEEVRERKLVIRTDHLQAAVEDFRAAEFELLCVIRGRVNRPIDGVKIQ